MFYVYGHHAEFHCEIRRGDAAEALDLVVRGRHPHLEHRDIVRVICHEFEDCQRQSDSVVVILLAPENLATRFRQDECDEFLRRSLACAPGDPDHRAIPPFVYPLCSPLHCSDAVIGEDESVLELLENPAVLLVSVRSHDCRDRPVRKSGWHEEMSVSEIAVEAVVAEIRL